MGLLVIRTTILTMAQTTVLYGSIQMIKRRSYRLAVVAALISIVPLISPFLYLGIPFGVLAMVYLCRKDVRATFGQETDSGRSGGASDVLENLPGV